MLLVVMITDGLNLLIKNPDVNNNRTELKLFVILSHTAVVQNSTRSQGIREFGPWNQLFLLLRSFSATLSEKEKNTLELE